MRVRFLFLGSALTWLMACSAPAPQAPQQQAQTLRLAPYLQVCQGLNQRLCMVDVSQPEDPQLMYTPIAGFDYEWGYYYTLQVNTLRHANPPADASSLSYELVEVAQKVPAQGIQRYQLRGVVPEPGVIEATRDGYQVLGQAFRCLKKALCERIVNLPSGQPVDLVFEWQADAQQPLLLKGYEVARR
ncbi:DUF4377 domain-containing protein [Idiomarina xiamenensis]|uniref:DUF4377 domain-containing protein n=1 Tax=Idiomarina xiamenensis 10-D-4 TaxID=740709 RepID=K2KHL2_9GAMM|nr:DUF4377 domain-containing protein [Idiomarina xiamenensis]EKE82139.1 hypothetical protein A10D4_10189 [Idiomarina xiamenensis 10-D-4]